MAKKDIDTFLGNMQDYDSDSLNIVEEQIDIGIQMSYFKRSNMLKKQVVTLEEVLEKVPVLYDPDARLEEKRDILVMLASFGDVSTYRILEKYKEDALGEIKLWAAMAFRENQMLLQGSLLEENQILISSGLGGKGKSLRYFLVFSREGEEPFTEPFEKIFSGELQSAAEMYNSEVESVVFERNYVKILMLVPLVTNIKYLYDAIYAGCEEFGHFIRERAIITNVRVMTDEEIVDIMNGKMDEADIIDIEDSRYSGFDVDDDYDLDDNDDNDDDDDL